MNVIFSPSGRLGNAIFRYFACILFLKENPQIIVSADIKIDNQASTKAFEKAGFVLEARSEVNANPKDTKDHPFGVWTLAPSRRSAPAGQPANPAFDRLKYDAIGESDRMTLRFRKPR